VAAWAVLLPAQKEYTAVVIPSASPHGDVERDRHDPRVGAPMQEGAPAEPDGDVSVLLSNCLTTSTRPRLGSRRVRLVPLAAEARLQRGDGRAVPWPVRAV
jgi:hypothetical protein